MTYWYEDRDNLLQIIDVADTIGCPLNTDELYRLIEKPWKFTPEHDHCRGAHSSPELRDISKCMFCDWEEMTKPLSEEEGSRQGEGLY